MKVFVAGGSGTIGVPLVRALVAAGFERLERSRGEPMLHYGGGLVPVRDLAALLGLPEGASRGPRPCRRAAIALYPSP